MRKLQYLLVLILILASVSPVLAQEETELRLTLQRNFGYASGGSEIQGAFTIRASGPQDLQRVVFYIDGESMGEAASPPFELRFHTESYSLGPHVLTAIGHTASGEEIPSSRLNANFVSAEEGFQAGMRIALPLFGIVFGMIVLTIVFSFVTAGKLKDLPLGTPRQYGVAGGAICPRCGRPFSRHFFSPNMLVGKLERCPFCGKWSILPALPLSILRTAEAAELEAAVEPNKTAQDEDERLRKELDESRFLEL
jgi:hypothetical protein